MALPEPTFEEMWAMARVTARLTEKSGPGEGKKFLNEMRPTAVEAAKTDPRWLEFIDWIDHWEPSQPILEGKILDFLDHHSGTSVRELASGIPGETPLIIRNALMRLKCMGKVSEAPGGWWTFKE